MNFKFSNLLGAPYRGGNVEFSGGGKLLISPVGNRVSVTDLVKSETLTLPCENSTNVVKIAVTPNGALLLSIDEDGRSLLINVRRRVVLHHFSFKGPVSAVKFSPNGSKFAVGIGKLLQIWRTPGFRKEFTPFQLLRSYASCHDTITCLDWSPDSRWILVGCKDLTARIFSSDSLENYHPVTLMGHRNVVAGVYFASERKGLLASDYIETYTIAKDGALFHWRFCPFQEELPASGISEPSNLEPASCFLEPQADSDGKLTLVHSSDASTAVRNKPSKKRSKTQQNANGMDNGAHPDIGDTGLDTMTRRGKKGKKDCKDNAEAILSSHDSTVIPEPKDMGKKEGEESETNGSLGTIANSNQGKRQEPAVMQKDTPFLRLDKGKWELVKKHLFLQNAKVTSCDYHRLLDLLVVGFSTGVFGLYQMPEFTCIHLLSISKEKITTSVFNEAGNWLAFGCAKLGQLLVWEWRSETYVLKQQGHYFDVNCVTYSPDSQLIATGADDNKLKVWNTTSGFCFVTFAEHSNAVTAVLFLPGSHAVLSASLDGTVRAWDLMRYRNFRTFTARTPTQFVSLAADPSGEVICAGSLDTFQIYVWSMKTGRLLDELSGHEGPVHGLYFSPVHEVLASSSWDRTVRLWDVFQGKGGIETFTHTHDVLTVVYRPDGKQLACSTLDGQIHFWDPLEGLLMGSIEGRRDIAGGRLMSDRRAASNSSSGKCFTTLCYSADGTYILAGGRSKYICMYDVAEQVLLRRFQISHNYGLDGVLDFLNSKRMTDAGPIDLIDDNDSDKEEGIDRQIRKSLGRGLPGAVGNFARPIVQTKSLHLSPTGRSWAAATTEGLLVYSMDDTLTFDPTDLDIDVTPEVILEATNNRQYSRALVLALRLNETAIIQNCIESTPPTDIRGAVLKVPISYIGRLIMILAELIERSPHLEFLLHWCQDICIVHGRAIQLHNKDLLPALKALAKGLTRIHEELGSTCTTNQYLLEYLCCAPSVKKQEIQLTAIV